MSMKLHKKADIAFFVEKIENRRVKMSENAIERARARLNDRSRAARQAVIGRSPAVPRANQAGCSVRRFRKNFRLIIPFEIREIRERFFKNGDRPVLKRPVFKNRGQRRSKTARRRRIFHFSSIAVVWYNQGVRGVPPKGRHRDSF